MRPALVLAECARLHYGRRYTNYHFGARAQQSSFLSGTYGMISVCYSELSEWAAEQGRKIACVDSQCMSTGLGLLIMELAQAIERNTIGGIKDIEDFVVSKLRKYLPNATYLTGPEWRCSAGIQTHGGPSSLHVNFHTKEVGRLEKTIKEMEQIIRGLSQR